MSLFAVTREAGAGWEAGGIFDQPAVEAHATFMNRLVDDGFVLFGGPLAGSEQGRVRVLLIVDAEDESTIQSRLAEDPWELTDQIRVVSIEPWKILAGEQRLSA
jgi:uncharacterized protein YciI